jgi:hypothetical protein
MKIFNGISELLASPSGLFSLLCLGVLAIVSYHQAGFSAAWVAFFGIVPAVLAYVEHKETLAQMAQGTNITTVINNVRNSITANQPPSGDAS